MALLTPLAAAAGLGGVDRYAGARPQRLEEAVECVRPHGLDYGAKLMAQNQRALDGGVADPRIVIRVQITAAETGKADPQQGLTGGGRARMGHALEA